LYYLSFFVWLLWSNNTMTNIKMDKQYNDQNKKDNQYNNQTKKDK
jgi:hypothetical protein